MRFEKLAPFISNLEMSQPKLVAICGIKLEEFDLFTQLFAKTPFTSFSLPQDMAELSQGGLFVEEKMWILQISEKLKKGDLSFLEQIVASSINPLFLLASSKTMIEPLYLSSKNEMLWLDLSSEKPWDKKDRQIQLLQTKAKLLGAGLDKMAAESLLNYENFELSLAAMRLETLVLYAGESKKITQAMICDLCALKPKPIDFAWVDELVFKTNSLESPQIQDPGEVLLFLGQLRYIVNSALKVKSIQIAGGGLNDIQALFPKLSQAALTHQIKKAEELSFEQLKQLSSYVFEKELELKSDFAQPQGVFLDLILKIRQLNFIKIS